VDERAEMCREYYGVLIAALRHVAERCGYAIAIHGSLRRDIDLVACPWRDSAISAHHLIEHVRKATEAIIGIARPGRGPQPEKKPCGRLGWSFYLTCDDTGTYLDVSVMPRNGTAVASDAPAAKGKR